MAAGEWFGMTPFQSTVSTLPVGPASNALHPFTTKLPCSSHMFYINGFFRESAMRRNQVYEYTEVRFVPVF